MQVRKCVVTPGAERRRAGRRDGAAGARAATAAPAVLQHLRVGPAVGSNRRRTERRPSIAAAATARRRRIIITDA